MTPTAVILAAGEGTRMRPLTYTRPKVMLTVANRPILEHNLIEFIEAGVTDFVFVVGYRDEQVRNYFGDGAQWGTHISYISQRQQLGTADAVLQTRGSIKEDFVLANGDAVFGHSDIRYLVETQGNIASLAYLEDVTGFGVIESSGGHLVKIHEKMQVPVSHHANAGLYRFTSAIFDAITRIPRSPRGEYELPDAIQILVDAGNTVLCHEVERWQDFSYPWDLLSVNEDLLANLASRNAGTVEPGAVLKGAVAIGKGSLIRSGSYVVGPVIIGDECDIGPNCYIRPATAIANGCHIGAGVEIKNSIIMNRSKVPHLSYVGDSVIGEDCNLGAGTKIANLKLNKQNISIGAINTGRRKLGAIIGDNVEIGINASINVGTLIGNNSIIGPGALAHGIIAPRSKIF